MAKATAFGGVDTGWTFYIPYSSSTADNVYFPITAAIYKVFSDSYLTAREGIASALGVWAMALLATALVVSTRLLGRKLGAIFRA